MQFCGLTAEFHTSLTKRTSVSNFVKLNKNVCILTDKDELRDLQSAIDVWNSETCVHFVPYRSGDKSWIRITDGTR